MGVNTTAKQRNQVRQVFCDALKQGMKRHEAMEYAEKRVLHPLFKRMHNLDANKKERFGSAPKKHWEEFGGPGSGRYPKGTKVEVHDPGREHHGSTGTVIHVSRNGTHTVAMQHANVQFGFHQLRKI